MKSCFNLKDVDWLVVYAFFVSPFLIIYATELWAYLFLLFCIAYTVYLMMNYGRAGDFVI